MKQITLQEVADKLKISRVTVSKVIHNKPGISLKTQEKVVRMLIENGYENLDPKLLSLVKDNERKASCIAIIAIAPEFDEFWLKIINSISSELMKSKYEYIYNFLAKNDEQAYELPKTIEPEHVSGVIVINVYRDALTKSLSETGIPTVFLDITPQMFAKGVNGDIVLLDGTRSICEITNHIISKGRTKIGFIGDITYSTTILERWEGFKKSFMINNLSINPKYCFTSSCYGHFYYREEIENMLKKLETMPEAFVCANDFIAYMLIDCLKERGYKIPEDIAVSGYDDIHEKFTKESTLTSVTINTDVLGRRLVKQVLMRIEDPDTPNEIIHIEPNVIYRNSTDF